MQTEMYTAIRKLNESEDDEAEYNEKLRTLAKEFGYKTKMASYGWRCVAGAKNGRHLHVVGKDFDYCPAMNNAASLW